MHACKFPFAEKKKGKREKKKTGAHGDMPKGEGERVGESRRRAERQVKLQLLFFCCVFFFFFVFFFLGWT